jgi:hypothetical protein
LVILGYVDSLPFEDDHDVFVMHPNAEITTRRRASERIVQTLQSSAGGSTLDASGTARSCGACTTSSSGCRSSATLHESLLGNEGEENAILDQLTIVLKQEVVLKNSSSR